MPDTPTGGGGRGRRRGGGGRAAGEGGGRRRDHGGGEDRGSPSVDELERRLGHRFAERSLLEAAWVHRSAANELGLAASYERLEFLGDAVLGMIAADWLYHRYPELAEGELSRRKGALVSAGSLARYARELGLGAHLVLGRGEERSGGRDKASLLADSLEALIAAVYLDGGIRAARKVVRAFLLAGLAAEPEATDAKSELQERVQALGIDTPTYRLRAASGPDHAKEFSIEVLIDGEVVACGRGRSKKSAEADAAARALRESGRPWSAPRGP